MRGIAAVKRAGAALVLVVVLALVVSSGTVLAGASPEAFDKDVARFDALRKDPGSSGRRDLWQALEKDFAALAKKHSSCPSGKQGGELGEFSPGQMVPEFDKVVFSAPVGQVQGPVKTQFGYHLVEVTARQD